MKNILTTSSRLHSRAGRLIWVGGCLLGAGLGLAGPGELRGGETSDAVVVSGRTADDYVRTRSPDGSFQPEAYAFGEGGRWGSDMQDFTIDRLKFIDVARTMAAPLASQNYLPTKVAGEAKLLIMVYWGTTAGTSPSSGSHAMQDLSASLQQVAAANSGVQALVSSRAKNISPSEYQMAALNQAMARSQLDASLTLKTLVDNSRDRIDLLNARMLGYNASGLIATDYGRHLEFTALRSRERDIIEEVEDNRYFVVLMAYDFQLLLKEKKHKLVWETRFSIRERGNNFSQALAGMALNASRYFGRDTHGLRRKPLPEGRVKLDELQILEVVPDK